jgi:SAM-dependent methyltransferase
MTAEHFNEWHANSAHFGDRDEIVRRHLGVPETMVSDSLLPWDAIPQIVAALRLEPGQTLLDLACGRGAYGVEIARRTGAALIGIDFSEQALRSARELARTLGQDAAYRVADMTATGLDPGAADAALCVDAIQFGGHATFAELHRVLAPGGRVALTCWEALDPSDERVPERLREVSLGDDLTAAGFDEVEVVERPAWRDAERAMWEEAAALDPGTDPALQSMHDEAIRSLDIFPLLRRVLATATRVLAKISREMSRR